MSPKCRKIVREITGLRIDLHALVALQDAEPDRLRRTQINKRISIVCALEMELMHRRRMTDDEAYADFVRRLDDVYAAEIARSN